MSLDWSHLFGIVEKLGLPIAGLYKEINSAKEAYDEGAHQRKLESFKLTFALATKQNLIEALIDQYYDFSTFQEIGLERYRFSVKGNRRSTTLVTKKEWIPCAIDLDGENDIYNLVDKPGTPEINPKCFADNLVMLEARGLRVWDAPIYRLLDVELREGRFKANFCLDSYFRYRFSNGSMQDEIITALAGNGNSIESVLQNKEKNLPLRQSLMPTAKDVDDCSSRICAGGVNVLTAIARPGPDNDYALILQQRSDSVSSRQGALTTIPAGHHQPMTDSENELPIYHTARRELFEELFGGDDVQKDVRHLVHDWYKTICAPISWLDQHPEAYKLCLTGIGYSLVTGSYNFSILLVIQDESFWKTFFQDLQTSWEAKNRNCKIISSRKEEALDILGDPTWTDYGLCAFVEGIRYLSEHESGRVKIPEISCLSE